MIRRISKIVLGIGIAAVILACVYRFVLPNLSGGASIVTSSALSEAIDIAELSTAEFKYRGIAEIYRDEKKTNLRCRVCYSAIVKAGVDLKEVSFEVDNSSKTVTVSLPEISYKVTVIDEQSIAVLPSDEEIGIDVMLRCSREDAENEASKSAELMSTAKENLKSTIEGLLYPILKPQSYSLYWN